MAQRSSSDSGGFIFKTGLFALLAGLAYFIFNHASGKKPETPDSTVPKTETAAETPVHTAEAVPTEGTTVPDAVLPASSGELVRHHWYVLSYLEDHEQAEWVTYEITRQHLNDNWAERPNTFRPDPAVRTESATPRDYVSTGYDKGHLCPAADMAFDDKAIDESFFMSNISPQVPGFNIGIWRELEELARDWARKFNHLYVVTGPVLNRPGLGKIGFSKVTVPAYYYKVLLAPDQGQAVAFVLPNAVSERPVMDYAVSVDKAEEITGIDFFPQLLKGEYEALEAKFDPGAWPVNAQRYDKRVKEWNR